jgi:hypothetical protein
VALDAELHREVALKQILERHADDPFSRQRFVDEAEITGGLEHPGSCPSTAWAPTADDAPIKPCGSSRGTASRRPRGIRDQFATVAPMFVNAARSHALRPERSGKWANVPPRILSLGQASHRSRTVA